MRTRTAVAGALVAVVVALLVGMAAAWSLSAWSGVDTLPPVCYSGLGRVVPCSRTPPVVLLPSSLVALVALAAARRVVRSRRAR